MSLASKLVLFCGLAAVAMGAVGCSSGPPADPVPPPQSVKPPADGAAGNTAPTPPTKSEVLPPPPGK